jgi:Fic/DOC family
VEIQAAWLHHRFAQIHPYQDGTGRVARALASLAFLKAGWFPVVVTRDDRARYIDSLEVADEGDLRSLIAFFVDVQKRALFQATQAAADVQPAETVDEAIAAAKRVLTGPGSSLEPTVWLRAKEAADRLMIFAEARLKEVAAELNNEISKARPEFNFSTISGPGLDLSPLTKDLGNVPNLRDYDRPVHLHIRARWPKTITIRAYAVGSKFRGLIGIVATFKSAEQKLASEEPFQVNYAESYESAERRFRPWLERSLVRALTMWRQSL